MRHGGWVQEVVDAVVPEKHLVGLAPKKAGKRWSMTCPRCGKTGKAYLLPGQSFIYCNRANNCGESSSVINMVANGSPEVVRGADFKAALMTAAAKVGVELRGNVDGAGDVDVVRASLAMVEKLAVSHLSGDSAEATTAREYLDTRAVDEDAARDLGIGLLGAHIPIVIAKKFGPEALSATGIEPLANHIVVVAKDRFGNPVGAHGRVPTDATFGLKTRTAAGTSKATPFLLDRVVGHDHTDVLIVEGLFDGLVSHAHGVDNAVALLGVNVTDANVRELVAAGIVRATLCLDADEAGRNGTLEAMPRLEAAGIETFVAPALVTGDEKEVG